MNKAKVILAVCTYHRNEPLTVLLQACLRNAQVLGSRVALGVVVVDDSLDGTAATVARQFDGAFELGLEYASSASENISVARNLALVKAMDRGDWIAMTDDDCEPTDTWLESLLAVQEQTDADVVTGLMLRRPGASAPSWLVNQGFLQFGEFEAADGQELSIAFTNNCLISSRWARERDDLRFDPNLGRIGGEDMVFFQLARSLGMRIHFSRGAIVHENEPADRLTLQYQITRYFWYGNSSFVTETRKGVSRPRMLARGGKAMLRAILYSPLRLLRGQPPHFVFSIALIAEASGNLLGSLGVRVRHH
jgi:succinoglycan biosynthesis protein ExoM